MRRQKAVQSVLAVSPGILVLAGAGAATIATYLPWYEVDIPKLGIVGQMSGHVSIDLFAAPWLLHVTMNQLNARGLLTAVVPVLLLAPTLLIRKVVLVSGIVIVLLAVIAGWTVETCYALLVHLVTLDTSFNAQIGLGPYVAAIGVQVWALGGLIALAENQHEMTTAWSRIGALAGSQMGTISLWVAAVPMRQRRVVAVIAVAGAFGVAASIAYLRA